MTHGRDSTALVVLAPRPSGPWRRTADGASGQWAPAVAARVCVCQRGGYSIDRMPNGRCMGTATATALLMSVRLGEVSGGRPEAELPERQRATLRDFARTEANDLSRRADEAAWAARPEWL